MATYNGERGCKELQAQPNPVLPLNTNGFTRVVCEAFIKTSRVYSKMFDGTTS